MVNIANRIKELRCNANMTQTEFGDKFGIVKSTVSLYESGKSTPSDELKLRICKYFNVTLDYLVGNSDTIEAEFYRSFSEKLNYELVHHGKGIADLETVTDATHEEVTGWLFENKIPTEQKLKKICEFLQISRFNLIGEATTISEIFSVNLATLLSIENFLVEQGLPERMPISGSELTHLLTGAEEPSAEVLEKIASAYGLELKALISKHKGFYWILPVFSSSIKQFSAISDKDMLMSQILNNCNKLNSKGKNYVLLQTAFALTQEMYTNTYDPLITQDI